MQADALVLTATGTVLVFMGIASISLSKNLVKTMMSFQVVLFGANLALFASGLGASVRYPVDTFVLLSITVGAATESVGLAIVLMVHKKYGTLDPSKVRRLKR
jgi:NADH:ubiquinone oxidoreductase subunit K